MKPICAILAAAFAVVVNVNGIEPPIARPGQSARYHIVTDSDLRSSVVKSYTLALGPVESIGGRQHQWLALHATKASGAQFHVWLLSTRYPSTELKSARQTIARYILQESDAEPLEFRHRITGEAVLPSQGGWPYLLPRANGPDSRQSEIFPKRSEYLGHRYQLEAVEDGATATPPNAKLVELLPDVLIGVPSNMRTKDNARRYDNTDYPMVRLTKEDYRQMAEAGINCVPVDAEQLGWLDDLDVFYWGIGGKDLPYPESLYRSRYLGPTLFLDEPAVVTRDYVVRPKLEKDPALRKALTPQTMLEAFEEHFHKVITEGAPTTLLKGLKERADVDVGDMKFAQENLYSWETMVSSAAYELSQDPRVPAAMVFEPPGRVGTRRTLPEMNMTYGCQLPVDDPNNFTGIIYGFLRGAARLTDKHWGTSIYGAVDQADAFGFMTRAYDLGATHFFFWVGGPMATIPYRESLALARNLRTHAGNFPQRDLSRLRRAAEVAILLPPGYNLGHVHLGKGSLWGLGELNLERKNRSGVKYRTVMANFFTEIERSLRLGVAFDLLWDLPGIKPEGYREVVRVREDGKVAVEVQRKTKVLKQARIPTRPPGAPPKLSVELSDNEGKAPLNVTARSRVTETTAPVYYTYGMDPQGVYHNAVTTWEIFGPEEEDYRVLQASNLRPQVAQEGDRYDVTVNFRLTRPGKYRLRTATVDLAGRTSVVWSKMVVAE